jgi:hypothetical protein
MPVLEVDAHDVPDIVYHFPARCFATVHLYALFSHIPCLSQPRPSRLFLRNIVLLLEQVAADLGLLQQLEIALCESYVSNWSPASPATSARIKWQWPVDAIGVNGTAGRAYLLKVRTSPDG